MSAEDQLLPEQQLVRYLLGTRPVEETERLDALSITDDAFALRLLAIENDLVDSYVRGELDGDALQEFESCYLNSSVRREKLAFARALHQLAGSAATGQASSLPAEKPFLRDTVPPRTLPAKSVFSAPSFAPQWIFAAAAVVALFTAGYFALQNRYLHNQLAAEESSQGTSRQDEQKLQSQLDEQSSAIARAQEELARVHEVLARSAALRMPAILLLPQTRGTAEPVRIAVPSGTNQLLLQLELESNEFPQYRVALKDPATDKTIWTSDVQSSHSANKHGTVSVSLPSRYLKERNYLLQLTGIPAQGPAELLSSYMFQAILR